MEEVEEPADQLTESPTKQVYNYISYMVILNQLQCMDFYKIQHMLHLTWQSFTQEDIDKFACLDDSILSTVRITILNDIILFC
jgi:hypothetical protein